jgi:hypothetical protein
MCESFLVLFFKKEQLSFFGKKEQKTFIHLKLRVNLGVWRKGINRVCSGQRPAADQA